MNSLSLFDLHCDTAGRMLREKQPFFENSFAVSLKNAKIFKKYVQVMAFFTSPRLSDEEGFETFLRMRGNLERDPALLAKDAKRAETLSDLASAQTSLFYGVEDARILNGKIERVDTLYDLGIRIFTPLWAGVTCIGGSHDTNDGLTEFGKAAVERAISRGMIPDISHASVESADDIFTIAASRHVPVIASHSDVYDLTPVSRNLRNGQIQAVVASDGLIGVNLYRKFLSSDANVTADDVVRHIYAFLERGAGDHLALGCDMDGAELPEGLEHVGTLPDLADRMLALGIPERTVCAVFFDNAERFAEKYLIK